MGAPLNVISYGENYYKGSHDTYNTVHAEDHAMRKLPSRSSKRKIKVDLVVIRVNKSGGYGNSKPCLHCILTLSQNLPKKGYQLCSVYYTNEEGGVVCSRFKHLCNDTTPHVSKYYRERNYQMRKNTAIHK